MSLPQKRQCHTIGIAVMALFLIASLAPRPLASMAEPPADQPTSQPKDGDKNADKNSDDDDRPPLGGPRSDRANNDRPRRFGPEGRPRGMDGDGPPDRPGNFGPRDGRGPRRFGPDGEGPREGRRGMFPPPGQGDGPQPPIPPEVMKELEEIIRDEMPELHKRIMRWRENQPERFNRAMAKFQPSIREYLQLRTAEPDLAKKVLREIRIEIQMRRLAINYAKYRATDSASPDRAKIEGEMDKLVREQVDIRLERRAARIRFLEKRLAEEKEKLADDQTGIEKLYKEKLEELKNGRFEELDLGPGAGPGHGPGSGFKGPRGHGRPGPGDRPPLDDRPHPDDREPRNDRRPPPPEDRGPPPDDRDPPPDDEADEMSPP